MLDSLTRGAEFAGLVRDYFEREAAPLRAEIKALQGELSSLKARQPERGEPGRDGRDAPSVEDLTPVIERACAAVADRMRGAPGEPGEKGDPGSDGKDGAAGRDGKDGKDGDSATDEQVRAAVAAWLEANPPAAGKDGRDGIDGRDGRDGAAGEKGEPGQAAPLMAAAFKDHEGELIVTLTDGTVLRTGMFDGKDGAPGKDGRDGADPDAVKLSWGEDGRTLTLKLIYGDTAIVSEAEGGPGPFVIDRGVFKDGQEYQKGDGATWAGSYWIAQAATAAKPGEGNTDWRLAVKRGANGRDGKDGDKGPPGDKGAPGRDGKGW